LKLTQLADTEIRIAADEKTGKRGTSIECEEALRIDRAQSCRLSPEETADGSETQACVGGRED
jgi:hypothetical protein